MGSKRLQYKEQIRTLNQRMTTTLRSLLIEINLRRSPAIDYALLFERASPDIRFSITARGLQSKF
jgi:hypothetical protein